MVTKKMMKLAEKLRAEGIKEGVRSVEIYWSAANSDGDFVITVFEPDGTLHQTHGGGADDD